MTTAKRMILGFSLVSLCCALAGCIEMDWSYQPVLGVFMQAAFLLR